MGLDLNDLIPRRMVLTLPGIDEVEVQRDIPYKSTGKEDLLLDVYRPPGASAAPLPAVLLVSGNAAPEVMRHAKDWGSFVSGGGLVAASGMAAMLLVRSGQDNPRLNDTLDRFVAEALSHNAPLELINFPGGRHAFDILDDLPESRRIIRRTLTFLREHMVEAT